MGEAMANARREPRASCSKANFDPLPLLHWLSNHMVCDVCTLAEKISKERRMEEGIRGGVYIQKWYGFVLTIRTKYT